MTKLAQSSSFSCRWTYDVFISFRGEDTRTTFTGNLYNALNQRGIRTFIDDEELKRGEEITPSLFKAIKESRMAIIVFSENYASSTYCLDELVHILEYLKKNDRLVWPVFYDVDPSQVRHQRGSYGEALAKHEERFKDSRDKVQKWRLALSEAANLSGWELKQGNEYEYKFIGRIVEEISIKINRIPLHVTDCPVGLESRVLEVNSLLDVGSNSRVIMVGIYGIGGIGKTTIARAVYNLIGDQFEGLCFLSNVREVSDKHGLSHLQETLLTEILGENIKSRDVNRGVSIIKQRLCQKRVLLILDDVDKPEQLQAIAGRCDWFGCGSRIIITTRDKHLLASHEVERIYVVKELNHEEAIQLFSWKASRKDVVDSTCLEISRRVVDYCSGLPLALEVIGSNFYAKSIDEWDSALREYERIPDSKVLKVLKLTYDALEDNEKEIFLDVACFFKGDTLENVIERLLSVRDIKSEYALGVLIDKSLIKIEYGHVTMHDLIEDMGREIIRQESPKEPGGRSRLRSYQDILHVLQENTGTDKIEVIIVDLPGSKEVNWSGKAFKKMKNLRMLSIRNARFSRGPEHLPNSLRVLDWRHYPWELLPSDFHPTNLVNLNLSNSSCVLLKPLMKKLDHLTDMNLCNCIFLKQVPDLSGVPNLRKLYLDGCPSLTEIHDSVGFLGELRELSAERCTNLRTFPRHIKLPFLEDLTLSQCSSLQCFPEVLEEMGNLTQLYLSGTAIEELPHSIRNLTGLKKLNLEDCKFLRQVPDLSGVPNLLELYLDDCSSLTEIHDSVGFLGGLRVLSAGRCTNLKTFPRRIKLPFLKFLELSWCSSLQYFPEVFEEMGNITKLNLSRTAIEELPYSVRNLTRLNTLNLKECKFLRQVPDLSGVPNLRKLYLDGCSSLTEIHDSVGFLDKLRVLSAESCTNLETFPRRIKLPFLECLELSRCSSLQCFPEVLGEMGNLTQLYLSGTAIEELSYSIRNLTGLPTLYFTECELLKQLPTSVRKLCLSYFPYLSDLDLSFNSFTILPACIEKCCLLRNLYVQSCKQLRQIEGMPPNLEMFIAENCTSLTSLSSNKLLSQVFQRPRGRNLIFPGQEVPKWFDHYSNGESVSFWVRKEFPAIVLCIVVGILDNRDCSSINVSLCVRIIGTDEEFECNQMKSTLETDHICLFDLQDLFLDSKFMDLVEQDKWYHIEDKWYHIEVLCKSEPLAFESELVERGVVKCCGVHVYKQLNNMENIQFSRPSSPKRTCHELYNSNNDLKLGCSPLMTKQHTSLDMGDCDCESLDIQHQRCLALVPTGCETVSKHKGKDLSMYNDGSEWLSMHPCGQETLAFVNWDSNSMKSASTSDTISDQDVIVLDHPGPAKSQLESLSSNIGGKLHQTTSSTALPTTTDGSPRNRIEPTLDDIEMEAFYASLDGEETQRAIETLQDLLSKDFPVLLDQGLYSTMKRTLEYLSNLSVDGGVREEMRSVILELSRGFAHWSRDYGDASRKIELTTSNLLKADELEEGLGINKKHFREVKDTAAKREIYEVGKTLKAQRDELRQQVPHLRDEQESAINTQAKIKAEWSKLAEKFNNIKSQNCQN